MDSTEDRPGDTGAEDPRDESNVEGTVEADGQEAQGILRRSFIGISAFLAMLALLIGRLFYVQAIDPTGRAKAALDARRRTQKIAALRGEIHDVNGNVLARSIQRYKITVDQTAVGPVKRLNRDKKPEEISVQDLVYKLADILKKPDTDVKNSLDGKSKYAVVAEEVTPDVYNAIMDIGADFIYSEPVSKRSYPDGSIAGSVVGFLNSEGAAGGIELQFNTDLTGKDGERVYEISADGIRIPVGEDINQPAEDGKTIRLTVNRDIQYFAQQQVKARADELKAEWGTAMVMNIKDGSILAMADSSMIDPNNYEKAAPGDFAPRAVSSSTEPGSTEKILTSSAVIEEGLSKPTSGFDVPAELHIDGQTITDAFDHGAQKRTLAGIIADSMNTGTVLAGKQLSKDQRHDWLKKFGIGQKTGIELPGESRGILAPAKDWDVRQQYTVLFGQGVSQTPLQTMMAYQAVANKGVQLTPRIVESIVGTDGAEEKRPTPEGKRIISEKTAQQVRNMMEVVVTEGGAKEAAVKGWRVGGKTGTAEAPADQGGGYDGYTTSFIGIAPMEDPTYLVGIVLQRPKGDVTAIGCTPVFSKIMEKVLQYYQVPRSTTQPVSIPKFTDDETGEGR
ncbi:peptidoglycan D,D-transpeptidase FtsI family protein [Curtobacterium sp. S6]|uniref:peptidoglycan D,D-transpeptidase FtsI family protein n=1 Tax=Curtobacterium sp. S6 TaxID=1479623 RepID=UPI000B0BE690|nr:penicillin-binding protein 2 [Curtobacterium sp. S6]